MSQSDQSKNGELLATIRREGPTPDRIAGLYENDHAPVPRLCAEDAEIIGNFLFTQGYKNMWGGSPLPHTDDITPKEVLQNLISRDTTGENVLRGPNLGQTPENKIINLGGMALWQTPLAG